MIHSHPPYIRGCSAACQKPYEMPLTPLVCQSVLLIPGSSTGSAANLQQVHYIDNLTMHR